MEPIDDLLRSSGQYGPRVTVPDDADVQTRMLAFIGRDPYAARNAPEPRAETTRDGEGRPRCSASHRLVPTRADRSRPCSMPSPSSSQTRSAVARWPVADPANGQPPTPPAEASNSVTP